MSAEPEGANEKFEIELELRQQVKITGTLKDLWVSTGVPIDRLAQVLRGEDSLTGDEDDAVYDYIMWDNVPDGDRVKIITDDSRYELRKPR